jgi:hypothetical protein
LCRLFDPPVKLSSSPGGPSLPSALPNIKQCTECGILASVRHFGHTCAIFNNIPGKSTGNLQYFCIISDNFRSIWHQIQAEFARTREIPIEKQVRTCPSTKHFCTTVIL